MMSVILRIFESIWVCGISGSNGPKILSIYDNSALLHKPIRSVPALHLHVPHEVFLITLLTKELLSYICDSLKRSLAFFVIQLAVAVFVKLFSDHIVLSTHISIPIEVITNVRDSLSSSLLSYFSACFLLFLGLTGAGPPLRYPHILRQYVAAIIAWLLLV